MKAQSKNQTRIRNYPLATDLDPNVKLSLETGGFEVCGVVKPNTSLPEMTVPGLGSFRTHQLQEEQLSGWPCQSRKREPSPQPDT